ncbi:MAG: hypothetical protein EXR99_09095 [Gemmataceae bacterium]|nr:hypothetical protein [Gemmataceae bacterium]
MRFSNRYLGVMAAALGMAAGAGAQAPRLNPNDSENRSEPGSVVQDLGPKSYQPSAVAPVLAEGPAREEF